MGYTLHDLARAVINPRTRQPMMPDYLSRVTRGERQPSAYTLECLRKFLKLPDIETTRQVLLSRGESEEGDAA